MPDLTDAPKSNDPAVLAALHLYASGKPEAALDAAEKTLETTGERVSLLLVMALAERAMGRCRKAVTRLEEALEDVPERAGLWTVMGICRRDLGDLAAADDALSRALAIEPDNARALYQHAVVLMDLNRNDLAAQRFEAFTSSAAGRDHALAWSLLGVVRRKLGRYQGSVDAIAHAIALAPDDLPTRNALVITHHQAGNDQQARAAAAIALKMKDAEATRRFSSLGRELVLAERKVPFAPEDRDRNIISFSLWGEDPVYTHGAIVNAQIAPHVYPSWRCRFYCDSSVPTPIVQELRRLGAEIHLVRDERLLSLKPLWRFLVSDDKNVDRFICRDADSRLNVQEAIAVDDWVRSGLPFHVMRDHVYHMEVMLAGMWGGIARVLPNIRELADIALGYKRNRWNDQEFLRDIVWPLIRDRARVHDSVFRFRGAGDFPVGCHLPGKIHVGGAVKRMPPWPGDEPADSN